MLCKNRNVFYRHCENRNVLQALEKLERFDKTLLFSAESLECVVNDRALRGACHCVRATDLVR